VNSFCVSFWQIYGFISVKILPTFGYVVGVAFRGKFKIYTWSLKFVNSRTWNHFVVRRIGRRKGVGGSEYILFVFSIKRAYVSLLRYFYLFTVKLALFHSNGSTSNAPSLPQRNASSRHKFTPVSAKFMYPSSVSFQTADTTTVQTTHLIETLRQTFIVLLELKTVKFSVQWH